MSAADSRFSISVSAEGEGAGAEGEEAAAERSAAGTGSGIGREALAGAKTDRKARSAAEIRVSRGLSDCMHSL